MPSADDAERVRMSNMADGPVAMDIPQTMILNMNGKYFIFFDCNIVCFYFHEKIPWSLIYRC